MSTQAIQNNSDSVLSPMSDLLTRARIAARVGFYSAVTSVGSLVIPAEERRHFDPGLIARQSYELHERVLTRPGMREVMNQVEREDWATLPAFLACIPFDAARVWRKRSEGVNHLPIEHDDFPYPEYFLNDYHNQANGHLSMRSALTYEWQIRFLLLGTNRLMRQAVIDELPEGDHLDVLDVGCGTATWMTQAWLQNRRHRYTGIDLSPQYLKVARLFRSRYGKFSQMNVERLLPEWTGKFDVVSSIWLFHELPSDAIDNATAEIARVLKPSGKLLFMDSVQAEDTPERGDMESAFEHFRDVYSEPHFMNYQRMNLTEHFARFGLEVTSTSQWFATKLLTIQKR